MEASRFLAAGMARASRILYYIVWRVEEGDDNGLITK